MTVPPWPARLGPDHGERTRIGTGIDFHVPYHQILCGRKVNGQYVCQGEIAVLSFGRVMLPTGLCEDPPGSHHWRYSARARRQLASGRKPKGKGAERVALDHRIPELPLTRECPHCGVAAIITEDMVYNAGRQGMK